MDTLFETNLPFSAIPLQQYGLNQLTHYSRNQSLQQSNFSPQHLLLDLGEMCSVRYMIIENLKYGCEISVLVSELRNGPFIPVYDKEFFPQHKQRRIKLSALPCKFIRIVIHKGVHIQPNQIKIIGSTNERLAEEGYVDEFKLLVTNPNEINNLKYIGLDEVSHNYLTNYYYTDHLDLIFFKQTRERNEFLSLHFSTYHSQRFQMPDITESKMKKQIKIQLRLGKIRLESPSFYQPRMPKQLIILSS